MSWKTTLYDYVHHRNQMDIDYTIEPLLPFVEDQSFMKEQTFRLERRAETDKFRHLIPVKSETRLAISSADERNGLVLADITLKRIFTGQIQNSIHVEQRVEKERVTLSANEGRWVIRRIHPLETENSVQMKSSSPGGFIEVEDTDADIPERAPSVPLLNASVLPRVQQTASKIVYNRDEAARYADLWWDKGNPAYHTFEVDCSNYVSQCLFAGGAPMNYTNRRDSGWWYKGRIGGQEHWSFSWAVAQSLQFYLLTSRSVLRSQEVDNPQELDLGDVISYDWDGNGRFQHSTIVTAKDINGMPLVNAHTVSSKHRYWSYTDSPAWTARTRYRFLHIFLS